MNCHILLNLIMVAGISLVSQNVLGMEHKQVPTKDESAAAINGVRQRLQEYSDYIGQLRGTLAQKDASLAAIEQQLDARTHELAGLQATCDARNKELVCAKESLAEAECNVGELVATHSALQEKLDSASTSLHVSQDEIKKHEAEMAVLRADSQKKDEELARKNEQITALGERADKVQCQAAAQVQERDQEIARLKKQLEEYQALMLEVVEINGEFKPIAQ